MYNFHFQIIFESNQNRAVMVHHVLDAEAIDKSTVEKFESGQMSADEVRDMVGKLKVFVDGTMPIAGIINSHTSMFKTIFK